MKAIDVESPEEEPKPESHEIKEGLTTQVNPIVRRSCGPFGGGEELRAKFEQPRSLARVEYELGFGRMSHSICERGSKAASGEN